jgi:hypothetical protein
MDTGSDRTTKSTVLLRAISDKKSNIQSLEEILQQGDSIEFFLFQDLNSENTVFHIVLLKWRQYFDIIPTIVKILEEKWDRKGREVLNIKNRKGQTPFHAFMDGIVESDLDIFVRRLNVRD